MADKPERDEFSEELPQRRKRIWRIATIGFVGVILLIGIAPNLIAWTGSLNGILGSFVKLNGQMDVGSSSIGWFQRITLHDVVIKDESGEIVLLAKQVQSSNTLLNLVLNQQQLGQFTISGADVALITNRGGSNLERVLEPMLTAKEGSAPAAVPEVTINITDSRIRIRKENESAWKDLEQTAAIVKVIPESNQVTVSLQAKTAEGNIEATGQLAIDFTNEMTLGNIDGELALERFDCAIITPILYRLDQDITVDGTLKSRLNGSWTPEGRINLDVQQIRSDKIAVTAPEHMADTITIRDLVATGNLSLLETTITANQFALKCDCGVIEVSGEIDPLNLIAAVSGSGRIETDFQINGHVDLATIARAAPAVMSVREDVELESAKIHCEAFSRMENGQRRLLCNLELPAIAARKFQTIEVNGQKRINKQMAHAIEWRSPVRMTVVGRQANTPLWLELLTCESDFLTVNGNTDSEGRGRLVANGDLAKLKVLVEQFFDMSDTQLAGVLSGEVRWDAMTAMQANKTLQRDANRLWKTGSKVFHLVGNLNIDNFVYGDQISAIIEDQLVIKFGGNYIAQREGERQLESAGLVVSSANDQASITLARPIRNPDFDSSLIANVTVKGNLNNWHRRAEAFTSLPEMNLAGDVDISGLLTCNSKTITFDSNQLNANDFLYAGNGLRIRETQLVGSTDFVYDFQTQQLTSKNTTLGNANTSLRADQTTVDFSGNKQFLTSMISAKAELSRAMSWFSTENGPSPYRGKLVGKAQISMSDSKLDAVVDAKLDEFQYVSFEPVRGQPGGRNTKAEVVWAEKQVLLSGQAEYLFANDVVKVNRLALQGEGVTAEVAGNIQNATTTCRMNLIGTLETDAEQLVKRLQNNIGLDLQMVGTDSGKIVVRGPLFSPPQPDVALLPNASFTNLPDADKPEQLSARAQFQWQQGSIYGLPFGNGRIAMQADKQQLDIAPVNLKLTQGRLAIDPAILFGDEMLLTVKADKLIDRANISPEICRQWMKYVAPMLADATAARGKFSLDLKQDAALPLTDPLSGTADCEILLHSADVGPGPLGQQIVSIAEKVRAIASGKSLAQTLLASANLDSSSSQTTWLKMPEQTVKCRVDQGRVYHDQMIFQIKDVVIQTRGSVGSDQSLDLIATIPIRQEWVKDRKLLGTLAGNSVEIPIKGTISRPKFITEALTNLPKQLLQNSAESLIQEKAGQFLKDSGGKLLDGKAENLLKGFEQGNANGNPATGGNPLKDAAGKLLDDQIKRGFDKLIGPPKK